MGERGDGGGMGMGGWGVEDGQEGPSDELRTRASGTPFSCPLLPRSLSH